MNTRLILGAALLGLASTCPALAQVVPGTPGTVSPTGVGVTPGTITPGTPVGTGTVVSPGGTINSTTLGGGVVAPGGTMVPGSSTGTIPAGATVPGTLNGGYPAGTVNGGYPAGTNPAGRTRPLRTRRGTTTTTPGAGSTVRP